MTKAVFKLRDESGVTTTGMVLALLVTLSLLFTSAQVYRINSASAEVQDVADAAALAAESQVAEYMLVARFCDAVVLSLSLTGLTVTGLGIAALCTPPTAALSEGLIDAGRALLQQRKAFSERAVRVLNKLQEALPYLAAACAASVAQANNGDSGGSSYLAAAILAPVKGELLESPDAGKFDELLDEVESEADDVRERAKRAEKASQEADRAKKRAFERDCGDNPAYCMYERAAKLIGMSGKDNPLYASVDAWSFSVALKRAKAYYRLRSKSETVPNGSYEEQARAALRKKFYVFASHELESAYVHETDDSFEANFPHLPSNTAEMRRTSLYTDASYPVTESEGTRTMHAWIGCPHAASPVAFESIGAMEAGGYETCPACKFTAASMGKVAAASTSISNGFEYHYEAVAEEALVYEKAFKEAQVPKSQVRNTVSSLFGKLLEAARESAGARISPQPPGRFGAIAFVVNAGSLSTAGPFSSSFVSQGRSLGARAAIGSATLVDEGSDEGKTAINSALDSLKEGGGFAVGAAGFVLDAWSWSLKAYSDGQARIVAGVKGGLDALPLASASGLGDWAAEKLTDAIGAVGLQPAEIGALKPVLVNSAHVAAKSDGSVMSGYLAVKQAVVAHPAMSADLFSAALSDAEYTAVHAIESLDGSIEIASIELLGEGGPSIPLTIPLPEPVKAQGVSAIEGIVARLRAWHAETAETRVWE